MRTFPLLPPSLVALLTTSLLSSNAEARRILWSKKSLVGSGSDPSSVGNYAAGNNLMLKMGNFSFDTPGAQCSWDDVSEPIIIFPQAEGNRTYIALGMQLSINLTSLDPLTIMSASKLYVSYIQSGLRVRSADNPMLISDVNPLVPFQMSGPSNNQPVVLVTLLYVQPHPLVIDDKFNLAFTGIASDASQRQNFQFDDFCQSAAITSLQASTWVVINDTTNGEVSGGRGGVGGGGGGVSTPGLLPTPTPKPTPLPGNGTVGGVGGGTGGSGQRVTTILTTDANGAPLAITSTLSGSSGGGGGSGAGGGQADGTTISATNAAGQPTLITSTLTPGSGAGSGGVGGASVTLINTIDAAGLPTVITSTLASGGSGAGSGAANGGGSQPAVTTISTTDANGNPILITSALPPGAGSGSETPITPGGTPTIITTTDAFGSPIAIVTTLPAGVSPLPGAGSGNAGRNVTTPIATPRPGGSKPVATIIQEVTVTISENPSSVFTSTITFVSTILAPASSECGVGGIGAGTGATVTATVTVDLNGVPVGTTLPLGSGSGSGASGGSQGGDGGGGGKGGGSGDATPSPTPNPSLGVGGGSGGGTRTGATGGGAGAGGGRGGASGTATATPGPGGSQGGGTGGSGGGSGKATPTSGSGGLQGNGGEGGSGTGSGGGGSNGDGGSGGHGGAGGEGESNGGTGGCTGSGDNTGGGCSGGGSGGNGSKTGSGANTPSPTPTPTPGDGPCGLCGGRIGTSPITPGTPTATGSREPSETLTKLTVIYPIPSCEACSKNGAKTDSAALGTATPGSLAAVSHPVVEAGAVKDNPPGVLPALLLGGVAFIFIVFL
ncbi:hypothetical protein N657DRAFT_684508 [Parathielavia appendiculata]|uniref:Uncharacterized protein n=1 Tax=Parathielavia appendiculata TaxID=2587402 RepID=A0AAN6TRB1_9PEZI|nr:hypothetical protein N657DRAFT_684508 [Parathielavia appendiculata]